MKVIIIINFLLSIVYEGVLYYSYSRDEGVADFDFDHWSGVLGGWLFGLIVAFGPYLLVLLLQYLSRPKKKWDLIQKAALILSMLLLIVSIYGQIILL